LAAASEALQEAGIDHASLPLEKRGASRHHGVPVAGAQEFTEEQYRLLLSIRNKR